MLRSVRSYHHSSLIIIAYLPVVCVLLLQLCDGTVDVSQRPRGHASAAVPASDQPDSDDDDDDDGGGGGGGERSSVDESTTVLSLARPAEKHFIIRL